MVITNDKFPKKMEWGWQENRAVIRILFHGAMLQWKEGNMDEAKFILEGLISSNPNDNIGARYPLLALYDQMDFITYYNRFETGGFLGDEENKWFDSLFKNTKPYQGIWSGCKPLFYKIHPRALLAWERALEAK